MKYFNYDLVTGALTQYMEYPFELEEGQHNNIGIISAGDFTENDLHKLQVDLVNLVLIEKPVVINYMKPNQIKQYYEVLENSPIEVFGFKVDCDSTSETRLNDAITTFDFQDMYPGEFELSNGVKVIYWTFADNIRRKLTKEKLIELRDELIIQRAVRRAKLFRVYNDLKNRTNVTEQELYSDTTWA